jgi:transaldolase
MSTESTSANAASRWTAVAGLGQSIWYDNVARPALASGHLARLIAVDRVTGGTSNPSIFSKAVLESDLYDEELRSAAAGDSDAEVFERCAVDDIRRACDLLRPVWDATDGADGYISIEEEAALAFEVEGAVRRAHELRALVDRPNVMIKIPGTEAGVQAFRRLTRQGVNINMTLLFARERYRQIAEGYVDALEERVAAGEDVSTIASVASFFVSRIDTQVDDQLPDDSPLRGRIAVANAKLAYADVFAPIVTSKRWERLRAAGARVQRPLWASTGTKNPDYSPTLYIDELVGPDSITTVPDATLDAFRDADAPPPSHATVLDGVDEAREQIAALAEAGVDLDAITDKLERDGVEQFAAASQKMFDAIAEKRSSGALAASSAAD